MSAGFVYREIADRLWPVLRQSIKGHTVVYRATHGLVGHRFPGPRRCAAGPRWCEERKRRTTPLTYMREGEKLVIVASKGG